MYNVTEIRNEDIKLPPLKNWKWKPKTKFDISKKNKMNFGAPITSRQIGSQWYHGAGF
jgi:hypothetical protein